MQWVYLAAISCYHVGVWIAALLGNTKAKQWLEGRKNSLASLSNLRNTLGAQDKLLWMHCASLGEFEQGRPIIEHLKQNHPHWKVALTFFSPSGYTIRKDYPNADWVGYLPFDFPWKIRPFIKQMQADKVIFIKYEFWYYTLRTLKEANSQVFLVSGHFRENQLFFKWYGRWFRKQLHFFQHLFVQNNASLKLLNNIGIQHATVGGDTRVDRVYQLAATAQNIPYIENFKGDKLLLVVGSSWEPDEAVIFPLLKQLKPSWKVVLAPHDIKEKHVQAIMDQLGERAVRFRQISDLTQFNDSQVLVIDNIGMLSSIYQYADAAYIGGGFGVGIHNTLEPASFSLPIIFGPKYHKFEEARYFVQNGGGYCVQTTEELSAVFTHLDKEANRKEAGKVAYSYILENRGATAKVIGVVDFHNHTDKRE